MSLIRAIYCFKQSLPNKRFRLKVINNYLYKVKRHIPYGNRYNDEQEVSTRTTLSKKTTTTTTIVLFTLVFQLIFTKF